MIATIAGKTVQQSLRSRGIHSLAIVAVTAIIWKLFSDQSRKDR